MSLMKPTCVFCCRLRTQKENKTETLTFSSSLKPFPGSNGSKTLNDILTIYFIARKLLKFSDAKCLQTVEALTNYFADDGVFWMCESCECIVSEAVECHQQILSLQEEISALGDILSRVISESSGSTGGGKHQDHVGFQEMRKLICSDLVSVGDAVVINAGVQEEDLCHGNSNSAEDDDADHVNDDFLTSGDVQIDEIEKEDDSSKVGEVRSEGVRKRKVDDEDTEEEDPENDADYTPSKKSKIPRRKSLRSFSSRCENQKNLQDHYTTKYPDIEISKETFQEAQSETEVELEKEAEVVFEVVRAQVNDRPKRMATLSRNIITEDNDDGENIELDDGDEWYPPSDEVIVEPVMGSSPERSEVDNDDCDVEFVVKKKSNITKRYSKKPEEARRYACKKCNVVYRNIAALKRHDEEHEASVALNHKFDCECGFPASSEEKLNRHKRKIHQEVPWFACDHDQCNYGTTRRSRLKLHILTHSGEKRRGRKPILIASKNGKSERGLYECTQCTVAYRTTTSLEKHLGEHVKCKEEGSQYECEICHFPSRDAVSLRQHKDQAHASEDDLVCKICQKSFTQRYKLKYHLDHHKKYEKFYNSTTGYYECPVCPDKNRMNLKSFTAHKNGNHYMDPRLIDPNVAEEFPSYLCNQCGRSFTAQSGLNFHMEHRHGEKKAGFTCDVCGKRLSTEQSLKHHMKGHDSNRTKDYVCVTCGAQYGSKQTLDHHMARYHPDQVDTPSVSMYARPQKPGRHKCKWCDEVFPFKYLLLNHMPTAHKDLYSFVCDICSKAYTSASSLNLHKEVIHSDGKLQYACEGCGKIFVHKHYSLCHKRYCSGNKKKNSSSSVDQPLPINSEEVEQEMKLPANPFD